MPNRLGIIKSLLKVSTEKLVPDHNCFSCNLETHLKYYSFSIQIKLAMGPDQKYLSRVGSGQFFVARVVSGQPFGFGFGKFPLKMSNFSIFPLGLKIISSGSGLKVPGSKAGWPLFTAGQK